MSLNRRIGLGFTLGMDSTGGTSFTTIGAIVDGWDEEDAKADVAEIAVLGDTIKKKAKSQIDPGGLTFEIAYDPDNTDSSQALKAAFLNMDQSVVPKFRITYPSGTLGAGSTTTEDFSAHVTSLGRKVKVKNLVVCKVGLTKTTTIGFQGA